MGAFENPAHFLRGDKYGLATGDFDSVVVTGQTAGADPQPVTQRFLKLDNDNEDGVSFLAGTRGDTTRYYTGLLSSTDVGEPLDDGTQTLYWAGTIGVIWGDNTYHEDTFDLIVDFDTQTIKSASHIEPEGRNIIILNGKNVIIEGKWTAEGGRPLGRIEGTIKGLDSLVAGTLTGLIGQGRRGWHVYQWGWYGGCPCHHPLRGRVCRAREVPPLLIGGVVLAIHPQIPRQIQL